MSSTVKVLIVDDSAIVRQTLETELSKDSEIEVIGTAPDPYIARDMIVKLRPDVITLDIEMPRMDGLTFLKKLMHHFPLPIIIVSSLTAKGSRIAMEALENGAVEVLCKPSGSYSIGNLGIDLIHKIKAASKVPVNALKPKIPTASKLSLDGRAKRIIAIGASTGGTIALKAVLRRLPANTPPIMIVQHMPPGFTKSFAYHLNEACAIEVREAQNRDKLEPGLALLAPGAKQMVVRAQGDQHFVEVKDGPRVCMQRPSVEVLFQSVARVIGNKALGVMLTGMGNDGAKGMLAMKEAGAINIAQDKDSCAVFGMPRAAIEAGGVDRVVPLSQVASKILQGCLK